MGDGEHAMLGARAHDVADQVASALDLFGIGVERDAQKDKGDGAARSSASGPAASAKTSKARTSVELDQDVVAHCGDPMRLADRRAGERRAEVQIEVARQQHPGHRVGTHGVAAELKGLADRAVLARAAAHHHHAGQLAAERAQERVGLVL